MNDSMTTQPPPALPQIGGGTADTPSRSPLPPQAGEGPRGLPGGVKPLTNFGLLWFGQSVSLIGSAISDFALGIWVYQSTGSVLQFALISLAFVLPRLLVAPLAGVLVDRWPRRRVMLLSDCAHALLMGVVLLLAYSGGLQSWHLYLITALGAIVASFQQPAYQASIPQLVPTAQLGRANGLVDLAQGVAQLAAPLGGGLLLVWVGLPGIVLLDLLTFFVALATLVLVKIPPLVSAPAHTPPTAIIWRQELWAGWRFICQDRGLLALMVYITVTVFLIGFAQVLTPPLILSLGNEAMLGLILTIGGIGMLTGGVVMSAWGGPRPRIYGLLIFDLLVVVALLLAALQTALPLLALAAFLFFVGLPISRSSAQSIWQSKVPAQYQGRVFATRDMLAISATPLAYLVAGPLADYFFQPLLRHDGLLAPTLGEWIGVGPGRGIALLFLLLGLLFLLTNLIAWRTPALRHVEE
jgi:MFS family permease